MVFSFIKERWNRRKAEKQRLAEEADTAIWNFYHACGKVEDVDVMSGQQFEEFIARLFGNLGYKEIRLTSVNDQGGDLICVSPAGSSTVVQAKRWGGPVGNGAVQEVLGAMRHYSCTEGIVVTNSTFTPSAIQLAAGGADVTLRDRRWLKDKMAEFLPRSIPEFDRIKFDQIIRDFVELTRQSASQAGPRRKRTPREFQTLSEALRFAGQAKGTQLSVEEIKRLAPLVINASKAGAAYRAINQRHKEAETRLRYLRKEAAELNEALAEADKVERRMS